MEDVPGGVVDKGREISKESRDLFLSESSGGSRLITSTCAREEGMVPIVVEVAGRIFSEAGLKAGIGMELVEAGETGAREVVDVFSLVAGVAIEHGSSRPLESPGSA